MRDTVDKILRREAERLYEKSQTTGLADVDLKYLNSLIATHKAFIGDVVPAPTAPAQQSTADLLASLPSSPA